MDIRKELHKISEKEWGYKIIIDSAVIINQDTEPFVSGLQTMSERKANKYADDFIRNYIKTETETQSAAPEIIKHKSLLSKILSVFKRK
jgi:hypothetical protein